MKLSNNKVAVVIPTYNSFLILRMCLDSFSKQTLLPSEVIVVDNGSTDSTYNNVRKYFPKVKIIKLKKNTGVTGGRNAGINRVAKQSEYILFFDHDMVAEKNMIQNMVNLAKKDSFSGIITPKIYYWEKKNIIWAAGTNINLWTGQILFRGGRDKGQFDKAEEVQVAPAAILVKRELLDQIHGFDNRYFATYEDTDFCFRARKKGYKTMYCPEAVAYHQISTEGVSERKRLLERSFWIGRNRIIFMKDFGKNFHFFIFFSLAYLFYFVKLSLQQKDMKGLVSYVKGVMVGLRETF